MMADQEFLPFDDLEPDPDEERRLKKALTRRLADLELEMGQYESDIGHELILHGEKRLCYLGRLLIYSTALRAWIAQTTRLAVVAPLPRIVISSRLADEAGWETPTWVSRVSTVDSDRLFVVAETLKCDGSE